MFSTGMMITIFYILGIFLSLRAGIFPVLFLSLAGLITSALLFFIRRKYSVNVLVCALMLALGSVLYGIHTENPLLRNFEDRYITAEGVICSLPSVSDNTYKNRYVLKLSSVTAGDETFLSNQKILLNTSDSFSVGDRVTASGHLLAIEGISNQYEYDFSMHYKSQSITARLIAQDVVKVGYTASYSPSFCLLKLRESAAELINDKFTADHAAFLRAIILDDNSGFSKDYKNLLIRTGVHRVLYAPFIHISLIFLLTGLFSFGRKRRDFLVCLLLILYAFFNSSAPSILKAAAVAGIFLFRKTLYGFADKLETLSLVVLAMTIIDPLLCFNSGFVMSCASTILVYLSYGTIHRFAGRIIRKKRAYRPGLISAITTWLVFVIGTLPFSAYLFNGISVYAIVTMTLLSPYIMLILVMSPILFLSVAFFGGGLSVPLLENAVDIIARLPYIIEKLPFSYLTLKTPTILEIFIFYLAWWLVLRLMDNKKPTVSTKVLAVVLSAFCLANVTPYSFNTLSVNFVNVGQGDGAVLSTTSGDVVLIDGGGSADYQSGYKIGERVYLPYLISHGFTDIDVAILSHPHKDHAEGIIAACENLSVETLVMPDCLNNRYKLKLVVLSKERGFNIEYLSAGDEIQFDSGLNIRILAPDRTQLASSDLNEASLVCDVRYGEFSALFTGDTTDIADNTYPADIDLLKVAHHGSDTGTTDADIMHLRPEYAVISVGEGNTYGHPDDVVLNRLENAGTSILRTDLMGDIRFRAKKNGKIVYDTLTGG